MSEYQDILRDVDMGIACINGFAISGSIGTMGFKSLKMHSWRKVIPISTKLTERQVRTVTRRQ